MDPPLAEVVDDGKVEEPVAEVPMGTAEAADGARSCKSGCCLSGCCCC